MGMPAGIELSNTTATSARRFIALAFFTILFGCASFAGAGGLPSANAAETGERTISFYNVHNKESITITYKKDGRYIPSALDTLNHFLRDWRENAPTKMDPKLIDLIWELRKELGSTVPTHLISGYRSPKTNAMLRRIGRKVARRSMHMHGQAADIYFPDVTLEDLRNSALVRQIGGVGYYPRSAEHGFVHVDTGKVRHWPRLSKTKLAAIFRDHKKKLEHEHRDDQKGPIYLVQRNLSTNNTSVAASANNIRNNRTAEHNYPLPRPKPKPVHEQTPPTLTASLIPQPTTTPDPEAPSPLTVASVPVDAAKTDRPEPQETPKLRRSLVFFPLAILKRDGAPDRLQPETEDNPVSVREVAAVTHAPVKADTIQFTLLDEKPNRTLTASQLARVARQIVTREGKSRLMMSNHDRPAPNEDAKGGFLQAETTIIDLRGPSVDDAPEPFEERVTAVQETAQAEDEVDTSGEQPVAIPVPAGAAFSYR